MWLNFYCLTAVVVLARRGGALSAVNHIGGGVDYVEGQADPHIYLFGQDELMGNFNRVNRGGAKSLLNGLGAIPCGHPPIIDAGSYTIISIYMSEDVDSRSYLASYNCKHGYRLVGKQTLACVEAVGQWERPPACQLDKAGQNAANKKQPGADGCSIRVAFEAIANCFPNVSVKWRYSQAKAECERFITCAENGVGFDSPESCLETCSANVLGVEIKMSQISDAGKKDFHPPAKLRQATDPTAIATQAIDSTTNAMVTSPTGRRGPHCLPGVALNHSSCLPDSPKLVDILVSNVNDILDNHNYWRSRVDPPATPSLPNLQWDDQLAISAERWAAQCQYAHNTADSRQLPGKWNWVGQNICAANYDIGWADCINKWGNEFRNWTYGIGPTPPWATVGHYTQIVWANTTFIGCGRTKCNDSYWPYILICNYGAGGNIGTRNKSPYAFPYTVGSNVALPPTPPYSIWQGTTQPIPMTGMSGGRRGSQCLPGVDPSHSSCLQDGRDLILTIKFKIDEVLAAHNYVRRSVNPPAVSMPDLRWSEDLAISAERWAAQCFIGHNSGPERALAGWPWVGQNMRFSNVDVNWTDTVATWASEVKYYQYGVGPVPSNATVGHYTQIVWANTTYVGCGRAYCRRFFWNYISVCNYGAGGNVGIRNKSPFALPYLANGAPITPGIISTDVPTLPTTPVTFPPAPTITLPTSVMVTTSALPPPLITMVQRGNLSGGLRGPQCYPGKDFRTSTSCLEDSPFLVSTYKFNVNEILNAHNRWRQKVDPPSKSMPNIQWDEELAIAAERWASQCPEQHDLAEARQTDRWSWVGQNICWKNGADPSWTECIDGWGSESANWLYGIGPIPQTADVGHYTQIIWANTVYVGCGKARCQDVAYEYSLVCNYGPGGNIGGGDTNNPYAFPYQRA